MFRGNINMSNIYFVSFIIILLLVIKMCLTKTGDRAKEECKRNGIQMIECQRILYGHKTRVPADLLEFPHMALVGFKSETDKDWVWNCGGSLISSQWVLTAAHCLKDQIRGSPKVVILGTSSFEEEESEDLIQMRNITQTIGHPDYKPPLKYNDIALLKLDVPIQLNRDIRIACLQTEDDTPSTVIASGFGKTNFDNTEGSQTMMRVEMNIIPEKSCNKSLRSIIKKRRSVLPKGILPTQLCAGDLKHGGKDTCQGDSGGPLQAISENPDCKSTFPLYVIYGVTSFGRFCGFSNSPGIYTKVSKFIAWIEDIVWPIF